MTNFLREIVKVIIALLGSALGFLFGDINGVLIALFVVIVLDYITGVIAAYTTNTVSSKVGFKGILKKFLMLLVVCLAHILDVYVLSELFAGSAPLMGGAELLFIANDGISILENVAKAGVKIPSGLLDALIQLKAGQTSSKNVNKTGDVSDKFSTEVVDIIDVAQKQLGTSEEVFDISNEDDEDTAYNSVSNINTDSKKSS